MKNGRHDERHNSVPPTTRIPDVEGPPFGCLQHQRVAHSLDKRIIKIKKRIRDRDKRIKQLCQAVVGIKKAEKIMKKKRPDLLDTNPRLSLKGWE